MACCTRHCPLSTIQHWQPQPQPQVHRPDICTAYQHTACMYRAATWQQPTVQHQPYQAKPQLHAARRALRCTAHFIAQTSQPQRPPGQLQPVPRRTALSTSLHHVATIATNQAHAIHHQALAPPALTQTHSKKAITSCGMEYINMCTTLTRSCFLHAAPLAALPSL
jgi:hypothetical protein